MLPLRKVFITGVALLAGGSLSWSAKAITISPATLPDWTVGVPYSQTLTATACTPCLWSETGTLPPGISLHATTGVLNGTPSSAGTYNFTVVAASGLTNGSQAYTVVINSAIRITTASLPAGQVAVPYSQTIAVSGGTSPYVFSVSTGSLPAGLSLASATGSVSGTPTKAGSFSFTVQVTDHIGATATQTYTLTVSAVSLPVITTTSPLPNGTIGFSYSATLAATGGTTPYAWSIASGALPAGLALNATTGTIAGTPSASGTFTFIASVTDHNSFPPPRPSPSPLPPAPLRPLPLLPRSRMELPIPPTRPHLRLQVEQRLTLGPSPLAPCPPASF